MIGLSCLDEGAFGVTYFVNTQFTQRCRAKVWESVDKAGPESALVRKYKIPLNILGKILVPDNFHSQSLLSLTRKDRNNLWSQKTKTI